MRHIRSKILVTIVSNNRTSEHLFGLLILLCWKILVCHEVNFAVTGGTGVCRYENLWWWCWHVSYSISVLQAKISFQKIPMKTSHFSGAAMALLWQLMRSPIETVSPSASWRSLPLDRRLSDANLVVYAKTDSIQNYTNANATQGIGYLFLHIFVLVSPIRCLFD